MNDIVHIEPSRAELGNGLTVYRALPTRRQRMVGAWCFLDHIGPAHTAMHVGAHPHIGLQTFTWVLSGEILHRDSLGSEQLIRPGQVNLMTAGRGIVHTEDTLPTPAPLHAAQLWIALPPEQHDCAPAFAHHAELPAWDERGARLSLLAGDFAAHTAPTEVHTPLLGLDLASAGGSTLKLPLRADFEYGLLPLLGQVRIDGDDLAPPHFAYLPPGRESLTLELAADSRVLLLGGAPFAPPLLMWWNFVGFSKQAIAEAQAQWERGDTRFGPVGDGSAPRLTAPPLPWRSD